MDVVVEGTLQRADLLQGRKVLTRCASKYESGQPVDAEQ
jgi:cytochrome c-type biogenesis protein CcmE